MTSAGVSSDGVTGAAWLIRHLDDVPDDDSWLTAEERRVLTRFTVPKRRADWRLGRWTAKTAVSRVLAVDPRRVAVVAAADGAPEAMLDGALLAMSLSISHRAGVGLAVVSDGSVVGGDLELIEHRSNAFVREWFGPHEQALVFAAKAEGRRDEVACLLWSVKEAAAKVLRGGLRLPFRNASVTLESDLGNGELGRPGDGWHRSTVGWPSEGRAISGWWRIADSFVHAIAGDPDCGVPTELDCRQTDDKRAD